MLRVKMVLAAAVLVAASFVSAPLLAGDAVKLVPADALGLLVIDRLDTLDAKVGKAAAGLGLPLSGPLAALQAVPGLSDCLDKESSIAVAVLKGTEPGTDPVPVGYVPVKDFAAFVKLFKGEEAGDFVRLTFGDDSVLAAEKDGFALIVPDEEEQTLAAARKAAGGFAERLGSDLAWVDERDVAAVMSDAGISVLCAKAVEGIETVQQIVRAQGDNDMGAADLLNVYKNVFAVVDQEMEMVGLGLDVHESGDLVLQVRKRFLPAGRIAEGLAVPATPVDALGGLPAEAFIVAGGGRLTPALGNLMMDFSVEVMKAAPKLYGIGQEQADQMLESAQPMMAAMQSITMMLAVGSPDDTIYSRMVGVMEAENAGEYMKAYEEYLQNFAGMVKGSKGIFSMEMESKPIEIDGCKGVEIAMELPKTVLSGDANAEAMLEKIIGPGGKIRVFIVAADDRHVVLGYTNQRLLRQAIAALRSGKSLGVKESVKQTAAKVGAGNLGQGFFNPAGLIGFVNNMIATVAPEGQKIQLPEFPETPPVGWAVNADGAVVDARIVVPGEILRAGFGYAAQVRKTFQSEE